METKQQIPILLVDDRPENLLALQSVLTSPDYELVSASSGFEALTHLLHREFALILMDVQMPGMDGIETAALIRKREKTKSVPIIFVTAIYQELRHIHRGYESGAVDYLLKPYDPTILKSKVAVFADLYRQKQEIKRQSEMLAHEQAERSRAEAMRRHFQDVIDRLDHSIIWEASASKLQFRFVSARAVDLLGYPHRQWFEETDFLEKHIPPEDLPTFRKMLEAARETGKDQRCEHRIVRSDGTVLWFHTGVQIEPKQTFRGLSVEITSLKTAEAELRIREKKFRSVVDSNMIGHIFGNLEGKILDANNCFLELIGYSRQDLSQEKINWEKLTPPEFAHLDQRAVKELRETGVCTPFEKDYIAKDGTRVPVMLGAALLEESETEFVCFVLDLTEKKRAESEKERAVRAREEILEIVSHDLKNPLGAILMNASLLFRRLPADPDIRPVRKQLEVIQRSADRMKRLIEDLLDLAKVEAGRLPIEPKPIAVAPLVSAAVEMLEPSATQKQIQIEEAVQAMGDGVYCDRERVLQVFSNLIGNAVKFTPERGKVIVRAEAKNDEVQFEVIDTGSGIAEDQLPYIFDRYWQASRRDKNSTGLGLSISKGIIEAHGGRIWAESKPGIGSKFTFVLPRRDLTKCSA